MDEDLEVQVVMNGTAFKIKYIYIKLTKIINWHNRSVTFQAHCDGVYKTEIELAVYYFFGLWLDGLFNTVKLPVKL